MKTLKQAKVGDTVNVVKLHGEGAIKRRIMDMGLTKGVEVHVRKAALSATRLKLPSVGMSFPFAKKTRK